MRKLIWFYQIKMDFELVNDETMLEIPGVIIAYIIFFILATINVKKWK